MSITIASRYGTDLYDLEYVVATDAARLVLRDDRGREHHFARHSRGAFIHAATYAADGSRDKYCPYWDVIDALNEGYEIDVEPELGPRLDSRSTDSPT